ncbi:aspartate aminotransferase family protein [Albibacterium profundi]|uniref:Aspartate aminotransferase family protein n=1 Tax=Albibacterium profundi TaxID=3134906 RepID=A0ABV5CFW6_9SPHI
MLSNRDIFLLNTAQTSNSPRLTEIVSAEGVYLYGPAGEKYLDLVSGFAVNNIGHRHPKVVQAIKDQVDQHLHVTVYGEFVQTPQVKLAERLVSILPDQLNSVYFVNSGTEATEGAMKIAKKYTGRTEIIAAKKAYHGSTQGSLSLIGNDEYRLAYGPLLPNINYIQFNATEDLPKITDKTAAVILETVQGEAGMRVPDKSWLRAIRKRCDETGALLILDEIQTGFGRTGKMFAFEHFDVVPDILLVAKALGGGMPIGAFIAKREIMQVITDNPMLGHITTFGGHPVCCAAALASVDVILENKLYESVDSKAKLFRQKLQHPAIQEIRGLGFMMCVQLDSFKEVESVSKYCAEEGVMIDWFLHCETALRIAPPLIISEEEISQACDTILKGIELFT